MIGAYLLYAIIAVIAAITASYAYYTIKMGCPTFPTLPPMRNKMISVIQEDAKNRATGTYTVVDLGSGSGQLCNSIALTMPKARVIGIEMSLVPWLRSVIRQRVFGPSNLEFKRSDFFKYNLGQADVVITYLLDAQMVAISEKLRKELKPGALIMSGRRVLHGDWKPFKSYDIGFPLPMKLWLYRQFTPANLNEGTMEDTLQSLKEADDNVFAANAAAE